MKNFLLALRLVKIVRKYDYWNSYSMQEILKYCKALFESFKWAVETNNLDLIHEINIIRNRYNTVDKENSNFLNEIHKMNFQITSIESTHEAEIIRLKDIIQAKQVQIDKLLSEAQGE